MKQLKYIHIIYLLIFSVTSLITDAQTRAWQWAKRPNIDIAGYTNPAVSAEGNGNMYVTGSFVGTATFPTSPSPTTLTSAGEADIFIAKYDAAGNVIWTKRVGGVHGDVVNAIRYDGFGNIYIVGYYIESTDFDGTVLSNPSNAAPNAFIAKFSATSGNLLWVKHGLAGSPYTDQRALDVAVDQNGNAYITGFFGIVTFDPLPTMYNVGWWDLFVVKYNPSGIPEWQTSVGSAEAGYYSESGNGIAVDQSGKVFVTGTFNGSSTYPTMFGTIPMVSNGGGGFYENDFFIAKYDPVAGDWVWVKNGGASGKDYGNKLSLDASGNPYVNGYYEGVSTFGSSTLTSVGGSDYFVAKYLSNGSLSWIHSVAGIGYYGGNSSKVDANGNFYFTGTFDGTITVGTETFTSGGWDNSYIASWNTNGVFQWAKHIPGDYYSHPTAIDVESNGNILLLSSFASTQVFDCTTLAGVGYSNLSIAKLGTTNTGPEAPTIAATSNAVCNGSSTTLSISNGNLNNATSWKWYTGNCGGTLIGTGTSVSVSPTEATTYYVRGEGGCSAPGECASITIIISSISATIPDVKALNYSSFAYNTVYSGYAPAASITLTAQPSGGSGPYSYSWSNGATTQSNTVSPTANTTYTVVVTDASGCQATISKEITVKNVSCNNDKVYMCHIAGNSNHVTTICIDNNAVATHLAAGCSLGECLGSRTAPSALEAEVAKIKIVVIPNPSETYFKLVINTGDATPVSLRVMDILGRVVENRKNISVSESVKFGNNLKAGVYLAEIIQGKNRTVIRLLKK